MIKDSLKGVDLFSGAGGMSLGFEQAGFDIVSAFDAEERHVQTYRANFESTHACIVDLSKTTGQDIRRLSKLGNRTIDVLFGGPHAKAFQLAADKTLTMNATKWFSNSPGLCVNCVQSIS